jgi:hypothetical protein
VGIQVPMGKMARGKAGWQGKSSTRQRDKLALYGKPCLEIFRSLGRASQTGALPMEYIGITAFTNRVELGYLVHSDTAHGCKIRDIVTGRHKQDIIRCTRS